MVVKEKRGRRRYVAFEVTSEELGNNEALISALRSLTPPSRTPPKLIQFDGHVGVVRCDLRELQGTKQLIVKAGEKMGSEMRTMGTSGTLNALRKRHSLPEGEGRKPGPRLQRARPK